MLMNMFAIAIPLGMLIIGGIPLLGIYKIRRNGARTQARVSDVRLVRKASGRAPMVYTAQVTFQDHHNRTISCRHTSQGDYLSLFQGNPDRLADLIFDKRRPALFYLPKDKGDIGLSYIFCIVGLVGTVALSAILFV